MKHTYVLVDHPAPHPSRAKKIITEHPEVRQLFGPNPWSGVAIVSLVALQIGIAVAITPYAWWVKLIAAYIFGAYVNHALWVLVHECTHNLVYRNRLGNRWMAIIANLPMVFPMTVGFAIDHLKHHKYLGDRNHDGDVAPAWEGRLFNGGVLGRLTWVILYPALLGIRALTSSSVGRPLSWTRWLWVNEAVQIAFLVLFRWYFGSGSLLYMFFSSYFSVGPHPLSARWIQEHYVFREGQETYSYYGMLNTVAFNIGYHNEHHDLPQVPWNRLPKLKKMVPSMYDHLYAHTSWTCLWLRFLFDTNLHLHRIGRDINLSSPSAKSEPSAIAVESPVGSTT